MLVLHVHETVSACSPLIDLSTSANLRFKLKAKSSACQANDTQDKELTEKLNVWIENDKRYMVLTAQTLRLYKQVSNNLIK